MSNLWNVAQKDYKFNGISLHNPTISEISEKIPHEEDFLFVLKLFNTSLKENFDTNIENASEFQILQTLLLTTQEIEGLTVQKKNAIIQFFLIVLKDYEFKITENAFIFTKKDNIFILDNNNFQDFRNIISNMFGTNEFLKSNKEEDNAGFNPSDERAKKIAEKILKGRKVAQKQKNLDAELEKPSKGIIENYISILSIGLKIPSPVLCKELSFYNLVQEYKRYIAKTEWDLDIKQKLAGGTPEESPDFWMKFY